MGGGVGCMRLLDELSQATLANDSSDITSEDKIKAARNG